MPKFLSQVAREEHVKVDESEMVQMWCPFLCCVIAAVTAVLSPILTLPHFCRGRVSCIMPFGLHTLRK